MMAQNTETKLEHGQLLAFYMQLAEFVRTHTLDDIDNMVMEGTFGTDWPDIDADAPLARLPAWSELKPADPSRVWRLGQADRASDTDRMVTHQDSLAALRTLRIHLHWLTEIPEALARELAKVLDLTVGDCRRIAAQAPVAPLGANARFQIPLGTYFRDVLHLSDGIVQQWAEATLSFQQRGEHQVRLVLNSPAQDWAVAVSLGGHSAHVLDGSTRAGLIEGDIADIDRHQMAIVPFRPRP